MASIGCLEHAGRDQLAELIRAHARYLKKGGLGLIHFIGHVGRYDTDFFIRKYVFPGGWIPSLADVIVEMEKAGLEILDIENLRRHYALTLDVWAERFDRNWEQDPRARPAALRRALPPHLARVPLRLRRDVPLARRAHAPLPDRVLQGQRHASSYPMSARFPLRGAPEGGGSAAAPHRAWLTRWQRTLPSASRSSKLKAGAGPVALAKETSNLFRDRAGGRAPAPRRARASTRCCAFGEGCVEAEGMIPYEDLTRDCLAHGVMPAVVPQLKTITLGGAVAGVGIESSSHRHGLVHDTMLELDVLLGDGRVASCTPRQRARRPVLRLPELLRHARLCAARQGKDHPGQALRAAHASAVQRSFSRAREAPEGRRRGLRRRHGVLAAADVHHARPLRRQRAVHQRLHLREDLLPLDRARSARTT